MSRLPRILSVYIILYLMSLLHVMSPFVSNHVNLARIRECSDSSSELISRLYNSPTDGSVNRSISTDKLVRTECELRIAVLHDIHSKADTSSLFSFYFQAV